METLKVATLIEALNLIGQVSRIKDDSETARAVTKVRAQLDDSEEMSLVEWAGSNLLEANSTPRRETRSVLEEEKLKGILEQLQTITTQEMLHNAIARLTLSTGEWKSLAWMLTGYSVTSEQDARQTVETFLSDRLLLDERIEGIRRQFNPATPPPWEVS